jgi:hypothetical protein
MDIEKAHSSEDQQDWRSRHPLLMAREQGRGFICYHTNKLIWEAVQQAIDERRSIEVDVQQVGPEWASMRKGTI